MRRFADTMTWADDRRGFAIDAAVDARLGFIRKTYAHLGGEILAVGAMTWVILNVPALQRLAVGLISNFLIYLVAFFGASLISRKLMEGRVSAARQYLGAGIWVFFLSLLVAPLCMLAQARLGSLAVIGEAFIVTSCVFVGLTAYVFWTKKDFSFMRGALAVASWTLVGVALVMFLFGGFSGSPIWSILWVVLLAGWVLYDTSQVMHRRMVGEHVAASVDLLTDFVFMFLHIAMLLMGNRE